MWKLGDIEIKGRVVLAPMAGITSDGYRKFCNQFSPAIFVTEMVSDMGVLYENEYTKDYIRFDKTCYPVGVQLFGHDPECLAKAAIKCLQQNPNIAFFDVNMGCPVPKVTKTGAGSSLMKNPKLCGEIVRAIKQATSLPVTAKIRLGWNDSSINFKEVMNELVDAGVSMIGIHARTKEQGYTGEPRWELLKDIQNEYKVPIAISGNIYSLDDAINALEITKAQMVMVARGGVGNPFLIKQINTYLDTGERLLPPSRIEQLDYCLELAKYLIEEKDEFTAIRIYRGIASKFIAGFPNAKEYKARLSQEITNLKSLEKILNELKSKLIDE